MIIGLHHVHVNCADVGKTAEYFKDIFEAKELYRGKLRGAPFVRIEVKGLVINLTGTKPGAGILEPGKGDRGLDHFSLMVSDMDSVVENIQKKGVKVLRGPGVSDTGNKYAFIQGPEGIHIELLELKKK